MIQNLENKMELQINSLETRIEKMQEMFNKDLEEIKKNQSIMNNAITEIKNTLQGINSRITEAEDRKSEVEDRMVEINEAERNKEKRIKRNEDNLRDLRDNVKCAKFQIIGVPEEEDKKKGHEKILEEIIVENFSKMGKETATQVEETQSLKQDKPKAKHPSSVQFSSVAQSCPTLCNPKNCSTPGLPVHHQLPEVTQTHVHRVSDAIQPSHPLSSPSPPAPNPSQHQSLFQ